MPQISGDESVEVNNKTCKKRAASSKKKTARARHSLTSSVGRTPSPDKKTSANSGDGERDEENYQSILGKILRKKRKVGVAQRSASRKSLRNEKPSHSTKHVTHSLLQDELDEDTTREEIADDVTNPFAFK